MLPKANLLDRIGKNPPTNTPAPAADLPTSGREYLRWLVKNEPGIFLPRDWDAGAVPLVPEDPDLPDLGDLDWPIERAPAELQICAEHAGLIWQARTGQWQCVGCWASQPPPRAFVQRVSGIVVLDGQLWVVTPEEFNRWPPAWGRLPGSQDTETEFT